MTQQETIALWLEAHGHELIRKTNKRWTYKALDGYYFLGPNGSWRKGRNVVSSIPVSETHKRNVLSSVATISI